MTKASSTIERLGLGLYSPAEAAYLAQTTPAAVYRWMFGDRRAEAVASPTFGEERTLSFLDFVQVYIIERARERGVSLQRIRAAISRAEREGVRYPLATRDTYVVFDGELHVGDSRRQVEQFTGAFPGQMLLHDIASPFFDQIEFDADGLAQSLAIYEAYGRRIVMDPRFDFGEPRVGATGYPSYVLAHAAKAEGTIADAAAAYGVDEDDIRAAVAFHDRLDRAA